MVFSFLFSFISTACYSPSIIDDCDTDNTVSGQMTARLNGNDWIANGVIWNQSGASVQINSEITDGWRFSIVLQRSDVDETPNEMTADSDPMIFNLGSSGGGWVTAYPQTGDSRSSRNNGDGRFILQSIDGELTGCLEFQVDDLTLEAGKLKASPLGG